MSKCNKILVVNFRDSVSLTFSCVEDAQKYLDDGYFGETDIEVYRITGHLDVEESTRVTIQDDGC